MTFLVVSYLYAPAVSPRAFRWAAIAEHWAGRGDHVDVICGWTPSVPRERILNGVTVHAVTGRLDALRNEVRNDSLRASVRDRKTSGPRGARARRAQALARWIYGVTWRRLYWPDYACLWYWPAVEKGKELVHAQPYDAIISVSLPFTSHLVGYHLKSICPKIPWVMDVGDPFSFPEGVPQNNHWVYGWLNRRAERRVFRAADAVSVTTDLTQERYEDLFPECAHKVRVIPPVYSAGHLPEHKEPMFSGEGKIKLVFVGTLYRDIRNPGFLLRLFTGLMQTHLAEKVELHFFGPVNDCGGIFHHYAPLVGSKVFVHGVVEQARAMQAMKEAHILVNIGNATSYQLPSKVVEYVSLGKPVLNLATAQRDSSTVFLKEYPASLSLVEGEAGSRQVQALLGFIEDPPRVETGGLHAWLSKFSVDIIAGAYRSLISTSGERQG